MELTPRAWPLALVLVIALIPAGMAGGLSDPFVATDPGEGEGPSDPAPVVLVANSKSGTVQVIEAQPPYDIVRTIDVTPAGEPSPEDPTAGDDPVQAANAIAINAFAGDNLAHDLDLSPDGQTLYVSRGHLADVAAFDLTTEPAEMLWRATVDGVRADHMTLTPSGDRLFVSDLMMDQVIVLDPEDGSRLGTFPTGDYAHGVNVIQPGPAPDGLHPESGFTTGDRCAFLDAPADQEPERCIYAASIGDIVVQPREARDRPDEVDTVANEPYVLTIADADTLEVVRTLEFPDGIRPAVFSLTDEANLMYYHESMLHGIVEYDLEEGREIRRVQLPIDPGVTEDDYSFESPHHGLALSPDGSTLCAAGRASDYVALVSTETMLPEHIVDVGDAPGWAVTGPDGQTCWVPSPGSEAEDAEPGAHTVAVISYQTGEKLATIETDLGPKHVLPAIVPASVVG